jgi:hypothetical protein
MPQKFNAERNPKDLQKQKKMLDILPQRKQKRQRAEAKKMDAR